MTAGFADKSKTSAYVFQTDNSNIAADDGGHAINAKSVVLSDSRSIERAFTFAKESLGFAKDSFGRSLGLAELSVKRSQDAFEKSLGASMGQTLDIAESERTGGANRTTYIAGAALAAFVIYAFVVKS